MKPDVATPADCASDVTSTELSASEAYLHNASVMEKPGAGTTTAPESAATETTPPTPPRLTLATLNLFNFVEPPEAAYEFDRIYSKAQWQKKCDWLRYAIPKLGADIIGLQEVFSVDALKALLAELGYPFFALVDSSKRTDFVYSAPVVAIASRLPLTRAEALEPDPEAVAAMGLAPEFQFGRKILSASVNCPGGGELDLYVLHFKSQRPLFGLEALPNTKGMAKLLAHRALGSFGSTAQRGFEAMLLYHGLLTRREQTGNPLVLMGDFNGELDGMEFDGLWLESRAIHSADRQAAGLGSLTAEAFERAAASYSLKDAAVLFLEGLSFAIPRAEPAEERHGRRRPTHYHGSRGKLLDHILLSQDFDGSKANARGRVSHFEIFDEHLRRPQYDRDSESSDHAAVVVSLEFY